MALDIAKIRQQFPILAQQPGLVYLDSAATSQKPQAVLDAMTNYYTTSNANVHRGMHQLAEAATTAYETARETVATFINAAPHEIIFTKSGTESLNLLARSLQLSAGDTVILSVLEHHSNIVPWLQLRERVGINIEWLDIDDTGQLVLDPLDELLQKKTKLVSVTGLSNVLGVRPDLETIVERSHSVDALVCIDAAQLVAHHPVDIQALDCDFLTFSGHKLYGPTGIGVLYGKRKLLEQMLPFLGGGMMIQEVSQQHFTCAEIPAKFEAGTPPIAEAIGLAAAIDWLQEYPWPDIEVHETNLLQEALTILNGIDGVHILGSPQSACIGFTVDGLHPHDLTHIMGEHGTCLRAGHHCTQPLHKRLAVPASTRLSLSLYNESSDLQKMQQHLQAAIQHMH